MFVFVWLIAFLAYAYATAAACSVLACLPIPPAVQVLAVEAIRMVAVG